jgi:hypothetical protein
MKHDLWVSQCPSISQRQLNVICAEERLSCSQEPTKVFVLASEGAKCGASKGSCAPECTARGLDDTFENELEVKEGKVVL